jgi:hypothetical protein
MPQKQEEEDFHAIGYGNWRYIKEMLLGNRIITDDVLKFYSEKCGVPQNRIFSYFYLSIQIFAFIFAIMVILSE